MIHRHCFLVSMLRVTVSMQCNVYLEEVIVFLGCLIKQSAVVCRMI